MKAELWARGTEAIVSIVWWWLAFAAAPVTLIACNVAAGAELFLHGVRMGEAARLSCSSWKHCRQRVNSNFLAWGHDFLSDFTSSLAREYLGRALTHRKGLLGSRRKPVSRPVSPVDEQRAPRRASRVVKLGQQRRTAGVN